MACEDIFPFSTFTILPAYGPNTARILWSMSSPAYNGISYTLQLQKSKDGYTDWFDLDMTDPLTGTAVTLNDGSYLDRNLGKENQRLEWHYRAIVTENVAGGKTYTTIAKTYRHNLTDLEFGTIREILDLEYKSPDDITMLLLKPKTHKANPMELTELSSNINPITGQVIGGAVNNVSYGKTYGNNTTGTIGAFEKPILVHVVIQQNVYQQKDLASGHGSIDNVMTAMKSFSYPRFDKGDLLIDPINDMRYLFDQIKEVNEFKGVIPITFTGLMTQISRNDPEYLYPVPECAIKYILEQKNYS